MRKKILAIVLCTIVLAMSMVGCGETTKTNNVETPGSEANEHGFKDVNEIAESGLPVEEQYELAVSLIDMDTYLTGEYDNIEVITPVQALEMKNNGETFVVYHGRSDCRYCKYVYPGVSELKPEGMTVYYVNTDFFRYLYPEEQTSELYNYVLELHETYKTAFDFTGVPNLKYIKNGELEISVSNPLPGTFYADDATKESREEDLEVMKSMISFYLNQMNDDMNGTASNNTKPSATINK